MAITPPNPKHPCFAARTCDVTDSTDHQDYRPGIATAADFAAVQQTSHLFLSWSDHGAISDVPAFTQFSKGHPGSFTTEASNTNDYPYLLQVYDPIQTIYDRGHGIGMSQDGTLRWERGNTALDYSGTTYPFWNRDQILAHYYTSVQLRDTNGAVYWGNYRWNALSIDRDVFRTWATDSVRVVLQNTGTLTWEPGTKLSAYWQRCTLADCTAYLQDAALRPEQPIPDAETVGPGSHQVVMNGALGVVLYVKPPPDLYQGKNYVYYLRFDLRRPNGIYFADAGWHEQRWRVALQNMPPPPRPATPPCLPGRCPTAQRSATVAWTSDPNPDGVTFVWKHTSPAGSITGETADTSLTVNLERGNNTITVKTRDTTDFHTESAEVVVGEFLYDPDPPALALATLPQWSNATALNLTWSGSDALSGIADYTLEQQVNGGAWTTVLAQTQATSYLFTTLANNTTYAFRVTARDNAGNSTQQTRTVTIDRDPPSSVLTAPSGTLTKRWTMLRWQSSSDRAPIVSFAIDRLVNGSWRPLYAAIDGASSWLLFDGQATTPYALRIRATDAAGNQQAPTPTAQISFTTGSDASGLATLALPIFGEQGAATPTSAPAPITTGAYPPPVP